MPCSSPRQAWFRYDRNASGKRSIQFSPRNAFGDAFHIPCGRCNSCRLEWSADWGGRIDLEVRTLASRGFDGAIFATLTYDDEHLPPNGSLRKVDVQGFMKRVRMYAHRKFNGKRVRFFCGAEYGERLSRPHYHIILIGHDFREDRRQWRKSDGGIQQYRSEAFEKLWPFGSVEFGDCGPGAGAYVAQYSLKKVYGEQADSWYQGREPEFLLCSHSLGRAGFEVDLASNIAGDHVILTGGARRRIPKGFERFIPAEQLAALKEQRQARARSRWRDNTPERLKVREEVRLARMRLYRNRV